MQIKEDAYNLIIINKKLLMSQNKRVNKNIKSLSIISQQYYEKMFFNII